MDTTAKCEIALQLKKQVSIQDRKRIEPQTLAKGHSWCEKVHLKPIAYLGMQYSNMKKMLVCICQGFSFVNYDR